LAAFTWTQYTAKFCNNGVTTLTFWGHVTSLVMWPFDSRWAFQRL